MHFLTGRAEERLGFDNQSAMAEAMGFKSTSGLNKVERFMRQYFLIAKDVGDLTRIFCARLEAEQTKPGRMARLPGAVPASKTGAWFHHIRPAPHDGALGCISAQSG